jgi:hypothetical protein
VGEPRERTERAICADDAVFGSAALLPAGAIGRGKDIWRRERARRSTTACALLAETTRVTVCRITPRWAGCGRGPGEPVTVPTASVPRLGAPAAVLTLAGARSGLPGAGSDTADAGGVAPDWVAVAEAWPVAGAPLPAALEPMEELGVDGAAGMATLSVAAEAAAGAGAGG